MVQDHYLLSGDAAALKAAIPWIRGIDAPFQADQAYQLGSQAPILRQRIGSESLRLETMRWGYAPSRNGVVKAPPGRPLLEARDFMKPPSRDHGFPDACWRVLVPVSEFYLDGFRVRPRGQPYFLLAGLMTVWSSVETAFPNFGIFTLPGRRGPMPVNMTGPSTYMGLSKAMAWTSPSPEWQEVRDLVRPFEESEAVVDA